MKAVPYIYEFYLEGFFDNVDLNYIKRICQEDLGMPSSALVSKLNDQSCP